MKRKRALAKKKLKIDAALAAKNDVMNDTETPGTSTILRGRQADFELEKAANGKMENYPSGLREMIVSIIKEMSKEAGGIANLSRNFVDNPIDNGQQMAQPHVDMEFEEKENGLHQNPEYKEQELNDALTVIKKTMKLDAADPFNRPVDPVELEIPDYFDVINTPMDFGTICNNLENGLKYMNSADVFKDVQYIWYNCLKYNKKGDHILELMNRVKVFFMRHWKAAGLHCKESTAVVEPGLQHSLHNEEHSVDPFTPVAGNILPRFSPNEQNYVPEYTDTNMGAAESSSLSNNKRQNGYSSVPLANIAHLQQHISSLSNQVAEIPKPINVQPIQTQHTQHSSSLPESSSEQDEPNNDSAIIQKKRPGRGPTRCLELLNAVGRIKIVINDMGQPIGREASLLTSFLGLTARDGNLAPLIYPSWSKVPAENKENMWQKVLTKFDIDPCSRSWVLKSLGTKWRNFKSLLKCSHYDSHATDEERLADRDERVLPDQWSVLVSQWSSEKWQSISAKNKLNRAQQKFSHTSGKKSFARIREEEKAKRPDGQEPTQAELFILTRTRKNGQPVNEETAAVISQLRESTTKKEAALINTNEPQDEAYNRIMGLERKGGVSLCGLSAMPSRHGTEIPTRAEALRMVTEKDAEVLEMKEKLSSMEQTCAQMAAQMSTMVSMMATMQKASPGVNLPNAVDGNLVPVGIPPQSEPTSTSNYQVPSKQTRGRKKRR
ncbi:bromodomain-containing protein [Tanacetum coccineum]